MLEKYFECEHLSPDETEELLKIYANYINTNKPNKFKRSNLSCLQIPGFHKEKIKIVVTMNKNCL